MQSLRVETLSRSYSIHIFTEDFISRAGLLKSKYLSSPDFEKKVVLTDNNIFQLYEESIKNFCRCIDAQILVIPPGEKQKSWQRANTLYTSLLEDGCNRKTLLIALGGGVIGDLGGFVASTYLRGIPFIQVPTTLLAQVDSSVGGKVAINHPLSKNSIGTFYQPRGVYTFLPFLETLSAREYRSGLAEVVKYGVIQDRGFFRYLSDHSREINSRSLDILQNIVSRCCDIKARIVKKDEKESNIRAILNFGHTLGHTIEIAGRFRWRHGQAVAMGSLFAAYMALKTGIAQEDVYTALRELYSKLKLPLKAAPFPEDTLLSIMLKDKKNRGKGITFVLPEKIGRVKIVPHLKPSDVSSLLRQYYKEVS